MEAAENLIVLILLLVILVPLAAAWYAYHREESGDLEYLLSYWYGGLLGMFVYRSYKETKEPDEVRQCSNCSVAYSGEPDFCSNCGEELNTTDDKQTTSIIQSGQQFFCHNCKAELDSDATECDSCGRPIASTVEAKQDSKQPTTSIIQSGQRFFCHNCKTEISPDATHCDGCGRVID